MNTTGLILFHYAEIHYRFPFFFSYLEKKEPEIIADAPFRVNPDQPIPIFCLIKDADKYPIVLDKVIVKLDDDQGHSLEYVLDYEQLTINDPFWYRTHFFTQGDLEGLITINVTFYYYCNNRSRQCKNDNYRTSSHLPLKIALAHDSLPAIPGWYYGDPHYHSIFTNDQVEFGAPLDAAAFAARSVGLGWFAATDHSYDLDDLPDNFLKNDPNLTQWRQFQEQVKQWNMQHHDVIIIPGEEVSCGNHHGKNVHLLALGIKNFIPGKGDSAEVWLQTKPDLTIPEVLDRVEADHGVAFGAHVGDKIPLLQQKLLGRGEWHFQDAIHEKCQGVQIWNGRDFKRGRKLWIDLLLEGKRSFCIGANDAHGNFNRYRQLGIPFFKVTEGDWQKFGDVRTAIHCETLTPENVLHALKNGQSMVTNGPFGTLSVVDIDEKVYPMGSTVTTMPAYLTVLVKSTPEFGLLQTVTLFRGNLEEKEETIWKSWTVSSYWWKFDILLNNFKGDYIRMEMESVLDNKTFYGFTNPIWLEIPDDY